MSRLLKCAAYHARRLWRLSLTCKSTEVDVVYVDEALHRAALDLLQKRLDKSWSLADAVSFVPMQRLGLAEALTTDHHFEQVGFVCLLI